MVKAGRLPCVTSQRTGDAETWSGGGGQKFGADEGVGDQTKTGSDGERQKASEWVQGGQLGGCGGKLDVVL